MMKLIQTMSLIGLGASFGVNPAVARDWVLLDASKAPQNWQLPARNLD